MTAIQDGAFPETLAGIDIPLGLSRVLGKKPRYLSLLRKFLAGQKDTAAHIRSTLSANDTDTAERLAHTAKGTAGNIGASRLEGYAAELEQAIRIAIPPETMVPLLNQFDEALSEVITELEAKLPPERSPEPVGVDTEQLRDVCARMVQLLKEDDAAVDELLTMNSDLLFSAFPREFNGIKAAIRAFDLDAALARLEQAMRESILKS